MNNKHVITLAVSLLAIIGSAFGIVSVINNRPCASISTETVQLAGNLLVGLDSRQKFCVYDLLEGGWKELSPDIVKSSQPQPEQPSEAAKSK